MKNQIETKIIEIVSEQIGMDSSLVTSSSSYVELVGWDSLATMRIAIAIEEEFSIMLTMDELIRIDSVQRILSIVIAKTLP